MSVIDLYKFPINGYPNRDAKDHPPKFSDLSFNDNDSGIHTMYTGLPFIYNKDLLKSQNKYYTTYLNTQPKKETRTFITDNTLNCITINTNDCTNFLEQVSKLNNYLYKKLTSKDLAVFSEPDPVPDPGKKMIAVTQMLSNDSNNSGYIQKINFRNSDKLFIFGDYHGSFHTFFTNMLRLQLLGVLNLNTYVINDNYKIIFLGDIIDRGQHSIEILSIIFNFMLIPENDGKIIFVRGNHEDSEQSIKTTINFYMEYKSAYPIVKNPNYGIDSIFSVFKKLPSALILINTDTNERFWACHGYIHENNFDDIILQFIESDSLYLIVPPNADNIIFQFKWNDPTHKPISSSNDRVKGTTTQSKLIGITRLKEFLTKFNISFIIRGHNDNYSNALLLSKYEFMNETGTAFHIPLGLKKYKKKIRASPESLDYTIEEKKLDEIFDPTLVNTNTTEDTTLPVVTIKVNKDLWINKDYFPVLTISTNTDVGRNLSAGSFVVLHNPETLLDWNITPENKTLMTTYLDNKNITYSKYLKYSDTNYYKKYIKYKNKYLKLKKIYN